MFHGNPEDGSKSKSSRETSQDCVLDQFEDGIPTSQDRGSWKMEEHGEECPK